MVFRGTDLYVATWDPGTGGVEIVKVTSAGVSSAFASIDTSGLVPAYSAIPTDLAFDGAGNLYVAVGGNSPGTYWTVTPGGSVSSASSGTGRGPHSLEFDSAGNLYVTDAYSDVILKNGASFASSSDAGLALANGLLWAGSTLYARDLASIYRVSATGDFSLAAYLGTANSPTFALQPDTGVFYFINADNSPDYVSKVGPSGARADVCSLGFDDPWGNGDFEFGPDGSLYVSDGRSGRLLTMSVQTPAQEVQGLLDDVGGLGLPTGAQNSLTAKLDAALQSIASGSASAAKGQLQSFIHEAEAKCCAPQSGKTLTQAQADALVAAAQAALASL
jgi:hypothetical protein